MSRSLLLDRLTPMAFFLFGGFCLELGLLIGNDMGRLHCSDWHESRTAAAPHVVVASTTTKATEVVATLKGALQDQLRARATSRQGHEQEGESQHAAAREVTRISPPLEARKIAAVTTDAASASGEEEALDDEFQALRASSLVFGATHVKRNDFAAAVDLGVPVDPGDTQKDDVLILYTSKSSLPGTSNASAVSPAERAIENCVTLKVVYTEQNRDDNCIAVVGHPHESFHVHRFHRVPEITDEKEVKKIKASLALPLRHVPRTVETKGDIRTGEMSARDVMDRYLDELVEYLSRLKGTLEALKPIAQKAAGAGNTVVAMAVNWGQADLFVNFVCAARARNLDLSHLILFATDQQTAALASSLGVHVFEVGDAFGTMPTQAAGSYGDKHFGRMVLSKVYSVHLLVLLGYDVLLQDVDVVWRRNPLEFFASSKADGYDMIFQDDGSRIARYSPYFVNTGFYFVKNNDRTVYFFNHLIRMGDVIDALKCDQRAISIFLNENVSWRGLRVKVLGRDTSDGMAFPGGFHFHRKFGFMKQMLKNEVSPYVFHMSWTLNKTEKRKFLSQMGEWHVKSECSGEVDEEFRLPASTENVAAACCSAAPLVKCHYRDLPSQTNCTDFEPLDKNRKAFWS